MHNYSKNLPCELCNCEMQIEDDIVYYICYGVEGDDHVVKKGRPRGYIFFLAHASI